MLQILFTILLRGMKQPQDDVLHAAILHYDPHAASQAEPNKKNRMRKSLGGLINDRELRNLLVTHLRVKGNPIKFITERIDISYS